jgi:predicted CXXCH cytochrome family protein
MLVQREEGGTAFSSGLIRILCRLAVTAGSVVFILSSGVTQQPKTASALPFARPRNAAAGVRYVGSERCKLCHFAIYNTYSQTDMSHSTSLPARAIELGWLTTPIEFFNENTNRHYSLFARDSKVYETEYGVDSEGKEIFRHTEELAYIVGTGANGATPVVRRGNYLFQAPVSYYSGRKTWDLSPNYEMQDLGFSLPVSAECIACHAGRTQPVKGREGLYEDPPVVELGISCERCHGPGELHVKERMAGSALPSRMDTSIVNPGKLPSWLADNICMNCHEGDNRTLQPHKAPGDFRPGTPLNDTAVILKAPIDPRDPQSPLLEHYYSMSLSKCYRASKGKLGCQSCHDPHVQPRGEAAAEYFRGKCLRCHSDGDCSIPLQERLGPSPADACSICHMPKQAVLTVSHSTLTNHRVVRTQEEALPEIAFRAALPGTGYIHVNAVPGSASKVSPVVLLKAYRRELIGSHLQFKDYYFALLDRLAKAHNQDPFVLSALAQKALSDGDTEKAVSYARAVVNLGSTSANDYLLLDQVLVKSEDLADSIQALNKGISVAPYSNFLYQRLAIRQFSAGESARALDTLQRGLELHPEDSVLRRMREEALRSGLAQ